MSNTKLFKYQFCVQYGLSALMQCNNSLEWIMHSPSAHALSHPRPLLHHPRALIKPHNAHTILRVFKYYITHSHLWEKWCCWEDKLGRFTVVHTQDIPQRWWSCFSWVKSALDQRGLRELWGKTADWWTVRVGTLHPQIHSLSSPPWMIYTAGVGSWWLPSSNTMM